MSHHGKETFALTELLSSINFSPQELRRLRFEVDERLISHSEADERLATREFWRLVDRNTLSGLPSRRDARCGGISRPGYKETDESKSWMRREMDALKRELKDSIDGKEKREGMGTKWTDENDHYGAVDEDEGFYEPYEPVQPSARSRDDGDKDLKTWMREELEQVKKEVQDGVMEGKCRCSKKEGLGTEEAERNPRTRDGQGRRYATAFAETAV